MSTKISLAHDGRWHVWRDCITDEILLDFSCPTAIGDEDYPDNDPNGWPHFGATLLLTREELKRLVEQLNESQGSW